MVVGKIYNLATINAEFSAYAGFIFLAAKLLKNSAAIGGYALFSSVFELILINKPWFYWLFKMALFMQILK